MHRHPFGLSTSWNGGRLSDPVDIVAEASALGFSRIEAYCHFTPDQLADLARAAADHGVEITSLHSPCPVPVDASTTRPRLGDWLASTNESERAANVDAVRRTIDAAAEIGARAIVIHLGTTGVFSRQRTLIEMRERLSRLEGAARETEHAAWRRAVEEAWREREARKGPHLDAALRSIRALGEHAFGTPVRLGVECRDGYQEIPSLDELADVLAACDGLPVGYWHDAGHGAKLEYAGFLEHEELLRRYGDRLVGMHIHDTRAGRDHLAPGQGDTDFVMLGRYARSDTVRTMELHAIVTAEQVRSGVELLAGTPGFVPTIAAAT